MEKPRQYLLRKFLKTLFFLFSTSWIIFSFFEILWTGFVSNFFNVHIFLLLAISMGIALTFVDENS